jgi:hypothetical protein
VSGWFVVLLWFLIPFGFGIPGGVLRASRFGVSWPVETGLYVVSDVVLAFVFEPILRRMIAGGRKVPALARMAEAMKKSMARTAALYGGSGGGPFALILIAFCVDPMTGRAASVAAGHGVVSGWTLAIIGDTLSFMVYMAATLKLVRVVGDPNTTMLIVLLAMTMIPWLVRRARRAWLERRSA